MEWQGVIFLFDMIITAFTFYKRDMISNPKDLCAPKDAEV
jgi:hypothetical protein